MIYKIISKTMLATVLLSTFASGKAISTTTSLEIKNFAQNNSCVFEAVRATKIIKLHINLDAAEVPPSVAEFQPTNPSSYNFNTKITIYDSLGIPHILDVYYIKSPTANQWTIYPVIEGTVLGNGRIEFSTTGNINNVNGIDSLTWSPNTGAEAPQMLTIDMTCSTQVGGLKSQLIESPWQDGHSMGWNFHKKLSLSHNKNSLDGPSCIIALPRATTEVKFNINLNPADTILAFGPINPVDPASYNFHSDVTIYDSLGAPYKLTLYFAKTYSVNTWQVSAFLYQTYLGSGQLTFNSNGSLINVMGLTNLSWVPYSGAKSPQFFNIDMTCSSQYGSQDRNMEEPWQNGQAGGNGFRANLEK